LVDEWIYLEVQNNFKKRKIKELEEF